MSTTLPRLHAIALRGLLRIAMLVLASPLVLAALLWIASAAADSNVIPSELAASARTTSVLFCTEGTMVHGNGSWTDRLLSPGTFVCSGWRLRGRQSDTTTGAIGWPSSPRR